MRASRQSQPITREELEARAEIYVENYASITKIEVQTMISMLRHEILPAVSRFAADLCSHAARYMVPIIL